MVFLQRTNFEKKQNKKKKTKTNVHMKTDNYTITHKVHSSNIIYVTQILQLYKLFQILTAKSITAKQGQQLLNV